MKSYFAITTAGIMPIGVMNTKEEAEKTVSMIKRSNEPDIIELAVVDPSLPKTQWIKNQKDCIYSFADGSRVLVAFLGVKTGKWDFEVIDITADEDVQFWVETAHGGEPSDLDWSDVDYYCVLSGDAPEIEK